MEEDEATAKRTIKAKKENAKQKLEQQRYVKALRALVSEKVATQKVSGRRNFSKTWSCRCNVQTVSTMVTIRAMRKHFVTFFTALTLLSENY